MPRIAWSSSSRLAAARSPPRTRHGPCSRSPRRRPRLRGRCSRRSSRATPASSGAAPRLGWLMHREGSPARVCDVRRLRSRDDGTLAGALAHRRDRCPAGRAACHGRQLRDARESRGATSGRDHRPDRNRPGRGPSGPGCGSGRAAIPLVRRGCRARCSQRALRHGFSRSRGRATHGSTCRRAGRRHGVARPTTPRRAHIAVRLRILSRTSSARR